METVVVDVVVETRAIEVGVVGTVVVTGGEVARAAVLGGDVGRGVCSVVGTAEPGDGATSGRTST